jgi:MFS family permease
MRLGSAMGLGALIAYALAPEVTVLWIAAVAAGAGSASIEVGIASVVSDHTPLTSRAAAMAGWNAITGARGIVAAFTMSVLLQVGIVDDDLAALRRGHRGRGGPAVGRRSAAREHPWSLARWRRSETCSASIRQAPLATMAPMRLTPWEESAS